MSIEDFKHPYSGILYIFLIIALIGCFIVSAVGWANFQGGLCERRAAAMQVNYMFDPLKGCYIQNPNGSWIPLDSTNHPSIYQP